MKRNMMRAVLSMLALVGGVNWADAAVYNESGGLVIMEAENTDSALGNWETQTSLTGYTGSGHLQFLGNTYLTGSADSPLEYTFKINQAGLYYLHLRAAKTNIVEGTGTNTVERRDVANDCYVRVDGDYNAGPGPYVSNGDNAPLSMLQSDSKYYTYTEQATDKWKWEDGFGNGNGNLNPNNEFRVAVYEFKAGETYTLTVSGRSKFFRLDRIVFRHTSVSESDAQNTSTPESSLVPVASYVYDATTDFPSITNGVVPYYVHGAQDALAIDARIVPNRGLFATAERTFDGETGTYDVTITALREFDGECIYRFVVNGSVVGTAQNGEVTQAYDYAPQKHVFRNIVIPAGATIAVESNTDTNGKIPEPGGTAWARGRWREVSLTPSSLSIVKPPDGRIALVSDGNSPDPDDIGAKAVFFGILQASGYSDRLVHLSHSCDLDPFLSSGSQTIDATNELRRQGKLYDVSNEGISLFGPFSNLADHYNCRSNQTAAVADLTAAIDASTAVDPLWIIEAGEPDVIGYALSNSVPSARQYVHIISHHPANDNSGDYWTWPEIQAFGITEHQIGDQNVGLKTGTNDWDWAYQHPDPGIDWIYQQLRYAEEDGVVTFQTDKFDCSDTGMMYWWLTGADAGGNSNSTPVEMKAMLLHETSEAPPVVVSIPQVIDGGEWNTGSTWESSAVPTSGFDYTTSLDLNVNDASSSFGGDSLTVNSGGWLRLRDSVNTFVVNDLRMNGGRIYGATGNNVTFALDGSISILTDTLFQTYWNASGPRNLNILSKISGSNKITSLASNDASTHTVTIDHAANDFSGLWVSQNGTLKFNNAGAVGAADIEVQANGKLQILGDWNEYAALTVADTATASVDIGSYAWKVASLNFGGSEVADGTYTAEQLNSMGSNEVFTGSGTIQVASSLLLHHWKFDEGTGGTTEDSAGGYDGAVNGASWATDGVRGTYLTFDGSNDNVDPSLLLPQWSGSNAETWAVWIKDGGGNNNDIIVGNRLDAAVNYPNGSSRLFSKLTIAGTSGRFVYNDGNATVAEFDSETPGYSGNFPDGTWVHFAAVRDGDEFTFYINGNRVNSTPMTIPSNDMPTAGMPFFMGGEPGAGSTEHFSGGLDDVVVYGFALTAGNVADVMNGNYTFDSGTGEPPVVQPDHRPNILVIIADDHRQDLIGKYHDIVQTPTLDSLCNNGIYFNNSYVTTPICAASRASILTGLTERTHEYTFQRPAVSSIYASTSYPQILKENGYRTGFVGKYGCKLSGADSDRFHSYNNRSQSINESYDGQTIPQTYYIANKARDFIEDAENNYTNSPWCMSVSFWNPHAHDSDLADQYHYPPEFETLYDDVTIPDARISDTNTFNSLPEFLRTSKARERWGWRYETPEKFQRMTKRYYRAITAVDKGVEMIRNKLSELNIDDNTVIIYMGDNGYMINERQLAGKWFGWEECLQVPLIIYDPRTNAVKGVELDQIALNIDLAPTIAELAEIPIPDNYQGRSLYPLMTGADPLWREEFFFEHYYNPSTGTPIPRNEGVRTENWKYVNFYEDSYEQLYDLQNDPGEVTNVAYQAAYSNILEELRNASSAYIGLYGDWEGTLSTPEWEGVDNDLDGLPDVWELRNLETFSQSPEGDDDNDGYLNGHEFVAGTHPRDASSLLLATQELSATGTVAVSWDSVTNRNYVVQKRAALTDDDVWIPVSASMAGDGQRFEISDAISANDTNAFYNVEVTLPE